MSTTRYWLATISDDWDHEVQYEPWSVKPTARPEGEPWALYDADFYILEMSDDWAEATENGV